MELLQRINDNLPDYYWGTVCALASYLLLRRPFYTFRQWHWQRRLARQGGDLPEERFAAGFGPGRAPERNWRRDLLLFLFLAFVWAFPAVFATAGLPEHWLTPVLLGLWVIVAIFGLVRKAISPPPASVPEASDMTADDHLIDGLAYALLGLLAIWLVVDTLWRG